MAKPERKLSQKLSERQFQELNKHIPWGERTRVFSVLIDGMIELYNTEGGEYLNAAIINKNIDVADILAIGKRAKDVRLQRQE